MTAASLQKAAAVQVIDHGVVLEPSLALGLAIVLLSSLIINVLLLLRPDRSAVSAADLPATEQQAADDEESSARETTAAPAKPRVRISKDGWIRHDGGQFPFEGHAIIETVHASGLVFSGRNAEYARFWHESWWRGEADSWRNNILFYRIVSFPRALA